MSVVSELSASLKSGYINGYNYSGKWLLTILVIFFIHLWTIGTAPFLHSDEFLILDLGRIILHPTTGWSIAWLTDQNQPVFVWFYVGPVLQELVYQVSGQYGPRVFALIGALCAATVLVAWLLKRNISPKAAYIWGLVFLLDPLFVQSYSLGRVDSWTIGLCICSCWILRDIKLNVGEQSIKWRTMLAGALVTIAFFIWPSAVFLLPLIWLELINVSRRGTSTVNWRKLVSFGMFFGCGALVVAVLILIPIAPQIYIHFDSVSESIATNTRSGPPSAKDWSVYSFTQFIELFRILKFTPVLLVVALAAVVLKRKNGLILAVLVALMLMISTVVYIQRVQYLLPYLIAAGASLYQREQRPATEYNRRIRVTVLTACLVWCVSLSIFARTMLALDKSDERDRTLIYHAAKSLVGAGEYKVFMPYEFYYAARSLGWQMYKPYLAQNDPITPEILRHILPHVDYVIAEPRSGMAKELYEVLKNAGMREGPEYQVYKTSNMSDNTLTSNIKRLRVLYSIFRKPYGPYQVYMREHAVSALNKP